MDRDTPASLAQGRLRLVFRARGGKTYLAESFVKAPLKILRPFSSPDGRSVLQVLHAGPGVFGGDRYDVEVAVEAGASAVIVHPAATKLHRMAAGSSASQSVYLQVAEGARLEYYPALTIPFPEADLRQDIEVRLAQGAQFGLLEIWAMGRIERGEYLRFRKLSARTSVYREGAPVYLDALELSASNKHVGGWGMLEGHRYLATGYWHGPGVELDLRARRSGAEWMTAFGRMAPGQYYLRALFHDSLQMSAGLREVLKAVSQAWGISCSLSDGFGGYPAVL